MSFARLAAALACCAAAASAGAINTDSALRAGRGETTARTRLVYKNLERDIERYLAQQTVVYGLTPKLSVLGTIGYEWNSPGEDGVTDLALRGRLQFFADDIKRGTLSFSVLFGGEIPIGEDPPGTADGGYLAGLVGTFERSGWRVDADFVNSFRPDAPDRRTANLALERIFGESDAGLWFAVLEANYERTGDDDVLFLSPGLVYEIPGWKFEVSFQIQAVEDADGPVADYTVVFAVIHVF